MKLTIVHLYPRMMNIYGDRGNVLCLMRRAQWRGIEVDVVEVNEGDKLPDRFDLLFMGGGQDSGQAAVASDLLKKGKQIKTMIEDGLPALAICGAYQLFGHYFTQSGGEKLLGIAVFDITTKASSTRMIGNIVTESEQFDRLIGFENHSGQTRLGKRAQALGRVVKGFGNNEERQYEGVIYKNAIGTYLHGSFLPKNPAVADFLLKCAVTRKKADFVFSPLDDEFVEPARAIAAERP